jgi:hypothetical protein
LQLSALPLVSDGWLKETCRATTPSGRSSPAVADAPKFQEALPKSVSRYWKRTLPLSLMLSSNVTVPLPLNEKCGTLNHSTWSVRLGAAPVTPAYTAPPAPGFRSSQNGATTPFGAAVAGIDAFCGVVAPELEPKARKPLEETYAVV